MNYSRPLRAVHWSIAILVTCQLAIAAPGSTVDAFLADILSGLVPRESRVYAELKEDIFGA